jgi:cytochrome c peroxidase
MSCASCHHADKAFTDGLPVSPKDDGSKNTRNTPSVYNTSFYTQGLYWDGRAATLEANVRAAWEKQMMGKPDEVAAKLNAVPGYKQQFEANYGGPADGDRIAKALASFLRTLNSGGSAFDRWQFGGDQQAVDNDVKLGFELFNGKAGCLNCHKPPFFSDSGYHNTGVGMKAEKPDLGRGPIAKNEAMNGAFKTPSLRNVALTAPYFHDGSAKTLEEAVRHMASGGVENPTRDLLMVDRKLSDEEIRQLVKLLQALTSNPPLTPPTLPQ